MSDNVQLELYKIAIDTRDKLNENYHKWMTFYYVAIGAVLVALTTVVTQTDTKYASLILILSLVGLLISTFWHLSCKGYYYWLKSCMDVIMHHEKQILQSEVFKYSGVFTVFSEKVNNKKTNILIPTHYANISTPKLTLIFSFCIMLSWLAASIYLFFEKIMYLSFTAKIWITIGVLILLIACYAWLLPKLLKSKQDEERYNYI